MKRNIFPISHQLDNYLAQFVISDVFLSGSQFKVHRNFLIEPKYKSAYYCTITKKSIEIIVLKQKSYHIFLCKTSVANCEIKFCILLELSWIFKFWDFSRISEKKACFFIVINITYIVFFKIGV